MESSFASNQLWYVGGPMSGYANFNFPAFEEASKVLREKFKFNIRPAHEVDHGEHTGTGTQPWEEYLRGDLLVLLQCSGAIFLQGWPTSKGAQLEFLVASELGYPIYEYVQVIQTGELVPLTRPESFRE